MAPTNIPQDKNGEHFLTAMILLAEVDSCKTPGHKASQYDTPV
jgi:hypothetical protein